MTIFYWEGAGWYASRQDADGNTTYFWFGNGDEPTDTTGYSSAEWFDTVPQWADSIR